MPEGFLERTKVRAVLYPLHSEAVTQGVRGDTISQLCFRRVIFDYLPETLACQPMTATIEKQCLLSLVVEKIKTSVRYIIAQQCHYVRGEAYLSVRMLMLTDKN